MLKKNEDDKIKLIKIEKTEVKNPVFKEKVENFPKPVVMEKDNNVKIMEEVTNLLNESKFHYTEEHNIDKVDIFSNFLIKIPLKAFQNFPKTKCFERKIRT